MKYKINFLLFVFLFIPAAHASLFSRLFDNFSQPSSAEKLLKNRYFGKTTCLNNEDDQLVVFKTYLEQNSIVPTQDAYILQCKIQKINKQFFVEAVIFYKDCGYPVKNPEQLIKSIYNLYKAKFRKSIPLVDEWWCKSIL